MSSIGLHAPMGREARLPGMRAARFVAALAVSLALHGALLWSRPLFPVGRPPGPAPRPAQPIVLSDVRPLPDLARLVQPEAFRPEHPEAFAEIEALQAGLRDEGWRQAEGAEFVPPPPASAETPLPDAPDPARLDLRQQILLIDRQAASAERAALPRRFAPALPRVPGAPDITLPATAEAIAAASAGPHLFSPTAFSTLPRAGPDPNEMLATAIPEEPAEQERLQQKAAILDETPDEVTDLEPIERLLAVDVATFRAPDEPALYFDISIARAGPEALPVLPKDVLLIQDSSESITRTKLEFFKEGLVAYLRTLTTADRFNIMRYSESHELCFDEWAPVTTESLAQATRFIDAMRVRGHTDLFTPLQRVLELHQSGGRPMIAVLMTDAHPTLGVTMGVVDSSEIITRFSRANAGRVSLFTIGVGQHINAFLLDLLGHNNRGGSWILSRREDIPPVMRRAARELSRPVLANLDYRFSGDFNGQVFPESLTHLYLDRPLRLIGRAPLDQSSSTVLQIVGQSGPHRRDMVFELDLAAGQPGGESIRREWVAQKIYQLINHHLESGREDILQDIRNLSRRHHIPLPYGPHFPL